MCRNESRRKANSYCTCDDLLITVIDTVKCYNGRKRTFLSRKGFIDLQKTPHSTIKLPVGNKAMSRSDTVGKTLAVSWVHNFGNKAITKGTASSSLLSTQHKTTLLATNTSSNHVLPDGFTVCLASPVVGDCLVATG